MEPNEEIDTQEQETFQESTGENQAQAHIMTAEQVEARFTAMEERLVKAFSGKGEEAKQASKAPDAYDPTAVEEHIRSTVQAAIGDVMAQVAPLRDAVVRRGVETAVDPSSQLDPTQRAKVVEMAHRQLVSGAANNEEEAVQFALRILGVNVESREKEHRGNSAPEGTAATKKVPRKTEDPEDAVLAKYGI